MPNNLSIIYCCRCNHAVNDSCICVVCCVISIQHCLHGRPIVCFQSTSILKSISLCVCLWHVGLNGYFLHIVHLFSFLQSAITCQSRTNHTTSIVHQVARLLRLFTYCKNVRVTHCSSSFHRSIIPSQDASIASSNFFTNLKFYCLPRHP